MKTLEDLKTFFARDRFVSHNGIKIISVDENGSLVRADVNNSHLNAGDAVQGGMLFSAADFAFAVLANYLHPVTVTSSAAITYLSPCRDTAYITAESREISRYRHSCVHEVIVRDDKSVPVCTAQMNGFIRE